MAYPNEPGRRPTPRINRDISYVFGGEGRALIAQCAFVLAMPTLIVLAVTTKSLLIAGGGWAACLTVVLLCWILPSRKVGKTTPRL